MQSQELESKKVKEIPIRRIKDSLEFRGEPYALQKEPLIIRDTTFELLSKETKDYVVKITTADGRSRIIQLAFKGIYEIDDKLQSRFRATNKRDGIEIQSTTIPQSQN